MKKYFLLSLAVFLVFFLSPSIVRAEDKPVPSNTIPVLSFTFGEQDYVNEEGETVSLTGDNNKNPTLK